jgi:hypothetical protein
MSSDDTIKELRAHIKELEDRLDLTLDVIVEHMHQHTERLSNIEMNACAKSKTQKTVK